MRAWQVHRYGPHREVLQLEDVADPTPPDGGAVIDVAVRIAR